LRRAALPFFLHVSLRKQIAFNPTAAIRLTARVGRAAGPRRSQRWSVPRTAPSCGGVPVPGSASGTRASAHATAVAGRSKGRTSMASCSRWSSTGRLASAPARKRASTVTVPAPVWLLSAPLNPATVITAFTTAPGHDPRL